MAKIDELKKIQVCFDILKTNFNVIPVVEYEDDIHDFENGTLSEDDIERRYIEIDDIELEFPEECEEIFYTPAVFLRYMNEVDTLNGIDNSTVRTTHFRQTIIDASRFGWSDFDERLESFSFKGEGYKVTIESNLVLVR